MRDGGGADAFGTENRHGLNECDRMSLIPLTSVKTARKPAGEARAAHRLPPWFRVKIESGPHYQRIQSLVREQRLHTICEEARCPNKWECWNNRTATFLILGDVCTRRCHYCAVKTGRPGQVDRREPERVAEAVRALDLRHAVITSVNRDELDDGGASLFADTIRAVRRLSPACAVETLVPDFQGQRAAVETVLTANPDVFNHNIETVPRLFPVVRPQGGYRRSLRVIAMASERGARTKSGFMVGLGETREEIFEVLRDLRSVGCDALSVGQYLRPTTAHHPVDRYYALEEFDEIKRRGLALGFQYVESGPLVRSSYHADRQMAQAARGTERV